MGYFNNDNRTKNASRNVISAFFNRIILYVLTFVSRRLFIHYIGIEYLGINGLFSNILTLLSMADLGIGTALNISLYKPIAEDDTKKISEILSYFSKLYIYIGISVGIIGFSFTPFLKYIINLDKPIPNIQLIYAIIIIKNIFSYVYVYKSSIIYADQKNYIINKVDTIISLIRAIVQIVIIVILHNYILYILTDSISVLIKNIIISSHADKLYPFIKQKERLPENEKKIILSDVFSLFFYKVSFALLNGTDSIIISIIIGTIAVGLYSNYLMITEAIETFISLFFNSLIASIGNIVAKEKKENGFKAYKVLQLLSNWISALVVCELFILFQNVVSLLFGQNLLMDNLTVIAIVLNVYFSICMRPVWTFREGTGMYSYIRYIMLCTATLNIVLSVLLGKWIGVAGVIFATSISKLLTYFWYEPKVLFNKFFGISVKYYYKTYILNLCLTAGCLVLCMLFTSFIPDVGITTILIKSIIIVFLVSLIYFIIYHRDSEFKKLYSAFMGILKK